jgi:hypothetical protein
MLYDIHQLWEQCLQQRVILAGLEITVESMEKPQCGIRCMVKTLALSFRK